MKRIDPLHPHLYVELEAVLDWHFDKEYVLLTERTLHNEQRQRLFISPHSITPGQQAQYPEQTNFVWAVQDVSLTKCQPPNTSGILLLLGWQARARLRPFYYVM
ncbi:hypothetical protein [Dictyobacter arantiisoli]|uniref:Uncharacterized protein n=1 Tax=Dictyobacter arantiisoli TaxID=2014874 RepID=A0A5A5TCV6_9CHLR|nr:hypothetical protein KDI_29150 [Dictyobacter arantiisoli]